jgi:hypothetical protein
MSVERDLGTLIRKLNPYSNGRPILFGATAPEVTPNAAPMSDSGHVDLSQFNMELEAEYADAWNFKGQPHKINTAVRIMYRWPKFDGNNNFVCWVTDYMLVGFEGSGGN